MQARIPRDAKYSVYENTSTTFFFVFLRSFALFFFVRQIPLTDIRKSSENPNFLIYGYVFLNMRYFLRF
jgi:hypothetical protein